jgi:hypothetical protein
LTDESGKKTPEDVIKRHGIGHGNNPDLMSEIREKRASMVHQVQKKISTNIFMNYFTFCLSMFMVLSCKNLSQSYFDLVNIGKSNKKSYQQTRHL